MVFVSRQNFAYGLCVAVLQYANAKVHIYGKSIRGTRRLYAEIPGDYRSETRQHTRISSFVESKIVLREIEFSITYVTYLMQITPLNVSVI